jgi:DNA mismatch repair protein MutL
LKFSKREKLIRSLAQQQAIKSGTTLSAGEMIALVQDLFACSQPGVTAGGSPTYIEFQKEYINGLFKK